MQRRCKLTKVQNELDTAYMDAMRLVTKLVLTAAPVENGLDCAPTASELAHFEQAMAKLQRAAAEAKVLIKICDT